MSIIDDIQNLTKEIRDTAKRIENKQDTLLTQVGLTHSRLDFLEAKITSLGIDIQLLIKKVENCCKEEGENHPPPFDINYWRGNFLALPNYPYAFMYPAWSADARKSFRLNYKRDGNTHLPLSLWASYGGLTYNYYNDIRGFRDILIELKEDGIETCFFVITDAVDNQTQILPADAANYCDYILPKLKDLISMACLGWELNQVKGWNEHDDPKSGHHMINLSKYIRWNLPTSEIFLHLQPNWWAPHYEDGDEWRWWRDAPEVNGLLYQIRPDSSLSLEGDPTAPDGMYLALKYPVPGQPHIEGIAGRMLELGKKFVMFEHSKQFPRWLQVKDIVENDNRVSGYC